MNQESSKHHIIDAVFVICLLLMFLLSSLTVIAIGASIYKKNVEQTSENYSQRISFSYVTEKVRQSDINGSIDVEKRFGENVLVLREEAGGEQYNTYIYDYDGYLMEFFARADVNNFFPQSGQKILKINSFDAEKISNHLLSITIEADDGSEDSVFIAIRSNAR